MSGSSIDLAIGMIFYFFVVSLLCSTILEWLQANFMSRGRFLKAALKEVLEGNGKEKDSTGRTTGGEAGPRAGEKKIRSSEVDELYDYEPIKTLSKDGNLPAYITKEAFVAAVNQLRDKGKSDLVAKLDAAKPGSKNLADVDRDQAIGQWFEAFTDRVSGWFKRRAQIYLLGISALAVILCNLDSITVYGELYRQPKVTEILAGNAVTTAAQLNSNRPTIPKSVAPANPTPGTDDSKDAEEKLAEHSRKLFEALNTKIRPEIPSPYAVHPLWTPEGSTTDWVRKIFGLLVTILATLMGAPFWFDALNRIANLRQAGKETTTPSASGTKAG